MSRKAIIWVVIVAVVVIGGGAILLARGNNNGNSNMPMNMNQTQGSTSNDKSATSTVTIQNFAFNPANITVKTGTTVTWTNKDSTAHTVTETDGQAGPDSGDVANGKSYSFTFDTVGTFKYHCSIHPNMTGSVTVTQ